MGPLIFPRSCVDAANIQTCAHWSLAVVCLVRHFSVNFCEYDVCFLLFFSGLDPAIRRLSGAIPASALETV